MANDDDYTPLFQYDVALSFAGEDRGIVESIARQLVDCDVKVFYDEFVTHELWGKDLFQHLSAVYRDKAKYCLGQRFLGLNHIRQRRRGPGVDDRVSIDVLDTE